MGAGAAVNLGFGELKGAIETMGKTFESFKQTHADSLKTRDGLIDEKLKKITDDFTVQHETITKSIQALEAKASRPTTIPGSPEAEAKELQYGREFAMIAAPRRGLKLAAGVPIEPDMEGLKAYTSTFRKYLRQTERAFSPDEMKALTLGSDAEGGYYAAPPAMSANIISRIFEGSPLRGLAAQETIGVHEWKQPEDPNDINAGWVGELGARTETATPNVGMKSITPQEMYAEPAASQIMIEDAAYDLEGYLTRKVGDKLARVEATAFINGNGVGQPRGILTYPSGTSWQQIEQVGSGTSGAFTYSGLVSIMVSLKEVYHNGAAWMFKRASLANIMTLTDGASRLIFMPLLGGNFNNTPLLGYPLHYAADMPAVGAGALAGAFGNFNRGYQIIDRLGISMMRDPFTSKPKVLFYFRRRVGGDVVDYDAIKLQVLT